MKVVAIIQARMGSSRLPGKVLKDLAGAPLLARVADRIARTPSLDDVIVATTTQAADDAVVELCKSRGYRCFRGSENDVLDRYCKAADWCGAEAVVRATADNPLIDPEVIEALIGVFHARQPQMQYAVTKGFPLGLDAEIIRRDALDQASREADKPLAREHVTAHILASPEKFETMELENVPDLSSVRWTVDTPEDFQLAELIFQHFGDSYFPWRAALQLQQGNPQWSDINGHVVQRRADG